MATAQIIYILVQDHCSIQLEHLFIYLFINHNVSFIYDMLYLSICRCEYTDVCYYKALG